MVELAEAGISPRRAAFPEMIQLMQINCIESAATVKNAMA